MVNTKIPVPAVLTGNDDIMKQKRGNLPKTARARTQLALDLVLPAYCKCYGFQREREGIETWFSRSWEHS